MAISSRTLTKTFTDSLAALTYQQAAERLGCSARTIFSLVAAGKLRSVRISRRLVRIPAIELDRLLSAGNLRAES